MVSGVKTPAESAATTVTRPALIPQINTEVPDDGGAIESLLKTPPGQPSAGRATSVSVGGITESSTRTVPGSVRLNVNGTDTLPPFPTASESNPHCRSDGGADTTATFTESLNPSTESMTNVTPFSCWPVTMPAASTVATAGSALRKPNVSPIAVIRVSAGAPATLSSARTYSSGVWAWPAADAMILVESTASACARPPASTVATVGTVDVQPMVTLTGLPSGSRAVAVYCRFAPRAIVSTVRSSVTDAT